MKRLSLLVAIALALFANGCIGRLLLYAAPPFTAAGRSQPIPVVTNWYAFGALLLGALAIAVAAAGWAYARLLASLRDGAAISWPAVAGACALALAAAASAPIIFSSDVYAYAAYGEMARTGIAPYSHALLATNDPVFAAAIWQWGNPPPLCVYGPLFVALASGVAAVLAPLGTLAQLDGMRALSSLGLVLSAVAAYAAYPGDRRARALAAATIALNPVSLWCAAEGHNDALALAIVLLGYALVARKPFLGAAIAGLAATVKAPGAVAALPLVSFGIRERLGVIAGIAASIALAYPLLHGIATDLAPGGHYAPQASLQAVFAFVPVLAPVVALATDALLLVAGVTRLRRNEREGWIYLALALWVLVPNPYPWYGVWLLAAAALAPGTRGARVALLVSFASLLRYAPDAIGAPSEPVAVLLGLLAVAPLALLR